MHKAPEITSEMRRIQRFSKTSIDRERLKIHRPKNIVKTSVCCPVKYILIKIKNINFSKNVRTLLTSKSLSFSVAEIGRNI